jgi:hypothetical protein
MIIDYFLDSCLRRNDKNEDCSPAEKQENIKLSFEFWVFSFELMLAGSV